MLFRILELASSYSEELYNLGCFPSTVATGLNATGQVVFSALCIA
jgi:hypothetical protein